MWLPEHGVGAVILVPLLRNGPSPSTMSFVLTLEGTVRATGEMQEAPADTPLTLAFRVPVPTEPRVSYELRIVDAGGPESLQTVHLDA